MGGLMVEISVATSRVHHVEEKTEPPTLFAAL